MGKIPLTVRGARFAKPSDAPADMSTTFAVSVPERPGIADVLNVTCRTSITPPIPSTLANASDMKPLAAAA
jgi:hypothetical protein